MDKQNGINQTEENQENEAKEPQKYNQTQTVFQAIVSAYLFYLGCEGIAELVKGTSTIHPVIAVVTSTIFVVAAVFLAVRCIRAAWPGRMKK